MDKQKTACWLSFVYLFDVLFFIMYDELRGDSMKRIDLHNHLDGSLPAKTILELAVMSDVTLPAETVDEIIDYLTVSPDCTSLNEYLKKFDIPVSVLQTEACLEKAVYDLMEDLSKCDVCYAEIRFAPGQHLQRGLTQNQVVDAAVRGLKNAVTHFPIHGQLILCCMRGASYETNRETIDTAKQFLGKGVCCADLAGAEAIFPTSDYKELFAYAAEHQVPYVIHAGEADGPQSMWDAVSMGAKRLGHGIAAIHDEKLMEHLRDAHISLEVCVTSNVQTKGVASIAEHPILKLLDFGIPVTVNTDNMTVSGTHLNHEFGVIQSVLGMTTEQEQKLTLNAIESAFLNDEEKAALKQDIFG